MKIAFLGCGKIGHAILKEAMEMDAVQVVFVQDVIDHPDLGEIPQIREYDEQLYQETDLIIECATAGALKQNLDNILKNSDLMMFSATAFADREFEQSAHRLCEIHKRSIYLPHGAILGLDGIFDGQKVWDSVQIKTVKNPPSLGREDKEVTVVYEGDTRGACAAYPRNVNVHAEIAMAGIGFDRTRSMIVSDPAVHSNTHYITVKGEGVSVTMEISSFTSGGVTGAYTPVSAVGSFRRVAEKGCGIKFV